MRYLTLSNMAAPLVQDESIKKQMATLIHPDSGARQAVEVGSQDAQGLFGQGYVLEQSPNVPAKGSIQSTTGKVSTGEAITPAGKFVDEVNKRVATRVEEKRNELLNAPENFDTQLALQKGALTTALLEEATSLSPEELRWLTPQQRSAIDSGDKALIKSAMGGINTILQERKRLRDEETANKNLEEAKAFSKIETLRQWDLLGTTSTEELQALADASGLSLEQVKGLKPDLEARQTRVETIGTDNNGDPIKALIDSQTGETIRVLNPGDNIVTDVDGTVIPNVEVTDFATWRGSVGNGKITQGYDTKVNYIKGRSYHGGYDIDGQTGDEIRAPISGTVIRAVSDQSNSNSGYGNEVQVKDADGNVWRFGHLSDVNVSVGSTIKAGQLLGAMGSTGFSTGSHLHLEVKDKNGKLFDPAGTSVAIPKPPSSEPKTGGITKSEFINIYVEGYGETNNMSPNINDPAIKAEIDNLWEEYNNSFKPSTSKKTTDKPSSSDSDNPFD